MNSKVKQAQKEGASLRTSPPDLPTLSSKMRSLRLSKYPAHPSLEIISSYRAVLLYNNAVLRSFEKIADCEAIRPDIAGIMGAFGAALIARERYTDCEGTTMLSIDEIKNMEYSTTMTKCRGCTNTCRLTINHFSGGRKFITGNRCERGLGKEKSKNTMPNLFDYKFPPLF